MTSKLEIRNGMPFLSANQNTASNASSGLDENTVKAATAAYEESGCMVIENALDPDFIDQLAQGFTRDYTQYLTHSKHDDTLEVGNKRFMVSVRMENQFASTTLYANPFIYPIVTGLMGSCIINAFGVVASLPGSKQQKLHRDYPGLFDGYDIDYTLPTFALTAFVPLIDQTTETGMTRMYPGSHKKDYDKSAPYHDIPLKRGSVMLGDYRTYHRGLANKSAAPRPLLFIMYSRPWFFDFANYEEQQPVLISDAEMARVPKKFKHLFRTVRRFHGQQNGLVDAQELVEKAKNSGGWGNIFADAKHFSR